MSKLWNGLFHHCGCKLNSSLCICECRVISSSAVYRRCTPSGLLKCKIWSVTGKGVSNWSRKIPDWHLCYLWGGGLVGDLMKELKMVVVSHVAMQSFNTLSFLSLRILGRDLGVKRFSVLHSAVASSVQRFRSCWSDFILFVVFSGQKVYV